MLLYVRMASKNHIALKHVADAINTVLDAYGVKRPSEETLKGARLTSMQNKFPVIGMSLAHLALAHALSTHKPDVVNVGLSHDDTEKRKGRMNIMGGTMISVEMPLGLIHEYTQVPHRWTTQDTTIHA